MRRLLPLGFLVITACASSAEIGPDASDSKSDDFADGSDGSGSGSGSERFAEYTPRDHHLDLLVGAAGVLLVLGPLPAARRRRKRATRDAL